MAADKCRTGDPPALVEVEPRHASRCWFAEEVKQHGIRR
jgi:hypothetical protein